MIEIKDIHGKLLATIDAETLEFADLSEMDLSYADLRGANLRHSNLQFTNFTFASLDDADMSEADTNGMILDGASCDGLQIRLRHDRPPLLPPSLAWQLIKKSPIPKFFPIFALNKHPTDHYQDVD